MCSFDMTRRFPLPNDDLVVFNDGTSEFNKEDPWNYILFFGEKVPKSWNDVEGHDL